MSTYSEAWEQTDREIQDFYVNFALNNLGFLGHYEDQYDPDFGGYFFIGGLSGLGWRGWHVFQHNLSGQLFSFGSFDRNRVLFSEQDFIGEIDIFPWFNIFFFEGWPIQFEDVPAEALNYPRLKYNVRKSYWTGTPRRRRNL